MQHYRKTHTTYDCEYHIVWITKYRKKVFGGEVGKRVREILREVCKSNDVEILKDHVHLFVSVPPHLAVSKLVEYVKGKSSLKLMQEDKQISRLFRGRHLWGRGQFVVSFGNITDEMIMEYIENQDDKEREDGEFTTTE